LIESSQSWQKAKDVFPPSTAGDFLFEDLLIVFLKMFPHPPGTTKKKHIARKHTHKHPRDRFSENPSTIGFVGPLVFGGMTGPQKPTQKTKPEKVCGRPIWEIYAFIE